MSNEEKILAALSNIQQDMAVIKADIESLKQNTGQYHQLDDEGVKRQLETLNKMRGLLTKEEADALAAAIGE